MQKRVAAKFQLGAFNCPRCDVLAQMQWDQFYVGSAYVPVHRAICISCNRPSYWLEGVDKYGAKSGSMIHPRVVSAPLGHPDMPESVAADYDEARNIAPMSPRGASALLRVCIEKLCAELHAEGGNLNEQIRWLVANGLPVQVQRALDAVRVIGNNAVHPGKMDPEDVSEVCDSLFALVNLIVEDRITRPKMVDAVFSSLPEGARKAIEKRDGNS
ncbi:MULTISPECIES: DUF4145 domain-containing protein [Burkholderia]|uniref:DUF4145 domain-containing protein n=1 Tax=Burkholderia TaxID=32008 RepID=UPI0009B6EA64|nr:MULTISPECIES: DUF4145 domain-containing protein [Burkholderia]MCA8251584.1 DUF4145 domain-containing protein [Burkholderia multivorans]MCA8480357.1 DUF4145 domain-containing protein [Burkholderia multivorans]MCL4625077.1 DUF4145 domain-containing protein [Burkholderia multivorans]MCO1387218.1 DUF4145 domain-containing protein [Burkholderia multivorans]MDN7433820.1 DUF4145 domain-containing protein [Burkholderia multivorans]